MTLHRLLRLRHSSIITQSSCPSFHVPSSINPADEAVENKGNIAVADDSNEVKKKRKKLKEKRAVVRWKKKKKKDYQRMTSEAKILYKLTKARRKEGGLIEALKKIEPKEASETTRDPEILIPQKNTFTF